MQHFPLFLRSIKIKSSSKRNFKIVMLTKKLQTKDPYGADGVQDSLETCTTPGKRVTKQRIVSCHRLIACYDIKERAVCVYSMIQCV